MRGHEDVANTLREALAKDPHIDSNSIRIVMLPDTETLALEGEVTTLSQKEEAGFIAQQVAPNLAIDNSLTVADNRLRPDDELTRLALDELAKEHLPPSLGVQVRGGIANLVGDISSLELRERARRSVARVPGIREVRDDHAHLYRREVVETLGPERGQVGRKVQTVGEGLPIEVDLDAQTLVNQIEEKLADRMHPPRADEVRVTVANGVVRLTGFVKSLEERARAEVLARSVPGVTGVRNHLLTQDGRIGVDELIAQEIRRKWALEGHLSPADLKVFVVEDTAYLQGDVDVPEQAMEAARLARQVPGVEHVHSDLRVTEKHGRTGTGVGRTAQQVRQELILEGIDWNPAREKI